MKKCPRRLFMGGLSYDTMRFIVLNYEEQPAMARERREAGSVFSLGNQSTNTKSSLFPPRSLVQFASPARAMEQVQKTSISLGCSDREEVPSVLSLLKRYMTPSLVGGGVLLLESTWKEARGASHSRGRHSVDL